MKTMHAFVVLAMLVPLTAGRCFAEWRIAHVSKDQAKVLGMDIRSKPAGPRDVRVELEFAPEGKLKSYSRVDLRIQEEKELLVVAPLREERPDPERVVVSFLASRAHLDKIKLWVMVPDGVPGGSIYEVRVHEFVEDEPQAADETSAAPLEQCGRLGSESSKDEQFGNSSTFSPIWNVEGWGTDRLAEVGIEVRPWKHALQGEDPPREWVQVSFDGSNLPKEHDVVMTARMASGGRRIAAVRTERARHADDKLSLILAVEETVDLETSKLDIFIWQPTSGGGNTARGYRLSLKRVWELASLGPLVPVEKRSAP